MKIEPIQVYVERIDLTPGLTAKTYVCAKGRPHGVIEIVMLAVHASGTDKLKNTRRAYTITGVECLLDTRADLTALQVRTWVDPLYLAAGHEVGINMVGETATATAQIFVHYLWHPDN